jgi:hypothetical protein
MNTKIRLFAILSVMLIFVTVACSIGGTPTPAATKTGKIKIINEHVRASDNYPGGKGLPDTREYGVCFIAYAANNPDALTTPDYDMVLAKDQSTTTWPLPDGTYTIQEFQFDSEINNDPMYSPKARTLVRPVEIIIITGGEILEFGSWRTLESPGEFEQGRLLNPGCGGMYDYEGSGVETEEATEAATEASTEATEDNVWVLKQVDPSVGKSEPRFDAAGAPCNGVTTVSSTDKDATITASGTCQASGAQEANSKSTHTWDRPPDVLVPGETYSGTLTAALTGICMWQGTLTEDWCRSQTDTDHAVWQGSGWPGGAVEFPYQNLIFGNTPGANAKDQPAATFSWKVPGADYGGKTLLLQYKSRVYDAYVYTNFWYEWSGD